VLKVAERLRPIIDSIIRGAIASIPSERKCRCATPAGGP
jgi:hypothetical protein